MHIKFQQFDRRRLQSDGRGWDDIVIVAGDPEDQSVFEVRAGDTLVITTDTPLDGLGEPPNDLDPLLELYDPSGTLVANNDDGAPDGRNALINHTASSTGAYRVRAAPVIGKGSYTLDVSGATGTTSPLRVVSSSVADGVTLAAFPATVRLDFSEGLQLTSVAAPDLTVNGAPATGVTSIGGGTLKFDIAALAGADGPYTLDIAAGALADLQGDPNDPFSLTFTLDTTGPVVTASSISPGVVLAPGDLTYTATLDEDLNDAGLGTEDVRLVNTFSGQAIPTAGLVYDPGTDVVTVDFLGLEDGTYELTLLSGVDGFRDLVDNPLNGSPSFPLPSGQGDPAGDDFLVGFAVDSVTSTYPVPLDQKRPAGSLIYDPEVESAFHTAGDTDSFTVDLDGGQVATVVLTPLDSTILGRVELFDSTGASLGSADSPVAGEEALLQTVPLPATTSSYRIDATSVAGAGRYKLQLLLNAAAELEELFGASNDATSTAESIDGGSVALQGAADRVAVLGRVGTGLLAEITDIPLSGANMGEVRGMTHLAGNELLATDGNQLFTLTTGGVATSRGNMSNFSHGLAFLLDGRLFAVFPFDDFIEEINPANGATISQVTLQLAGENINGANGVATIPISQSTPKTAVLVGGGLGCRWEWWTWSWRLIP